MNEKFRKKLLDERTGIICNLCKKNFCPNLKTAPFIPFSNLVNFIELDLRVFAIFLLSHYFSGLPLSDFFTGSVQLGGLLLAFRAYFRPKAGIKQKTETEVPQA